MDATKEISVWGQEGRKKGRERKGWVMEKVTSRHSLYLGLKGSAEWFPWWWPEKHTLFPFSELKNVCCAKLSSPLWYLRPMPGVEYRFPKFSGLHLGFPAWPQEDIDSVLDILFAPPDLLCTLLYLLFTPAGWSLRIASTGLPCHLASSQPMGHASRMWRVRQEWEWHTSP